jgi:hypothetical protein
VSSNPYYVNRGDLVRVTLNLGKPWTYYTQAMVGDFTSRLSSAGLQPGYINAQIANVVWGSDGGDIVVDVQAATSDYNNVQDVANLVSGIAQAAGFYINVAVGSITRRGNANTINLPGLPANPPQPSGGNFLDNLARTGLNLNSNSILIGAVVLFVVVPIVRDFINPPRRR